MIQRIWDPIEDRHLYLTERVWDPLEERWVCRMGTEEEIRSLFSSVRPHNREIPISLAISRWSVADLETFLARVLEYLDRVIEECRGNDCSR